MRCDFVETVLLGGDGGGFGGRSFGGFRFCRRDRGNGFGRFRFIATAADDEPGTKDEGVSDGSEKAWCFHRGVLLREPNAAGNPAECKAESEP